MKSKKFVAYFRVSSRGQARSGLGLDAQRMSVFGFVGGQNNILAEFTEIESGRSSDRHRPALADAISLCRRTDATLIVAKLDRLARNVAFTSALLQSGLEFVIADMPLANRFTIHIIAAFAEYEHTLMCQRIRAAHEAARAQGRRIGRGFPNKEAARLSVALANAAMKKKYDAFAARMANHIRELRSVGITTAKGMAEALNSRGIPGIRGGRWHSSTVRDIDLRAERVLSESRDWVKAAVALQSRGAMKAIRRIRTKGFSAYEAIARELNRQDIPSPNGRQWSPWFVRRIEAYGEHWTMESHPHLTPRARDKLIKILPVANALKANGVTDYTAIARVLNEQGIEAPNNANVWTRRHVAGCLPMIGR